MKLTELNPHWIGHGVYPNVIIVGLSFLCPHCRAVRLAILFQNEIDPAGWCKLGVTRQHDKLEWKRTGETFDTISLQPSIDTEWVGHWHGFITNGEVS